MSVPFIAEIKIFAGNFAPRGWAFCDGQLLPISQNTALFALVGTIYGGDGRTTFGIPNLRDRAPMHPGTGPGGLTTRRLGEGSGVETVTLSEAQMANHTHSVQGSALPASVNAPDNTTALARGVGGFTYGPSANLVALDTGSLLPAGGGGVAHNNLQPFLTLNFIIALTGTFPSRN
ncbi:MAG: tail fiber protein [Phycisphaerae bacterium]